MASRKGLGPRKQPVQSRSKTTVDVIVEAAAQVFEAKGYTGANTNLIAKRAGVSVGSLYQYFSNKDSILYALMKRHMDMGYEFIIQRLSGLGRGGIDEEFIRALVEAMLGMHEVEPELHRVMFEQVPPTVVLPYELMRNEAAAVERLAAMLERTPGLRKDPTGDLARFVAYTLEMLCHRYALYGIKGLSRERFIAETTDMLLRYLLTGQGLC